MPIRKHQRACCRDCGDDDLPRRLDQRTWVQLSTSEAVADEAEALLEGEELREVYSCCSEARKSRLR